MTKNNDLTEEGEIANEFNKFFTNIGPETAGNELKEAFFSLKVKQKPRL